MDSFPNIRFHTDENGGLNDPFYEEEFENGDDTSRPMFTSSRERETSMTFPSATKAERDTLLNFYESHRGVLFAWTDPETAEVFVCRFVSNSMDWSRNAQRPGRWNVVLRIKKIRVEREQVDNGTINDPVDEIEDYGLI